MYRNSKDFKSGGKKWHKTQLTRIYESIKFMIVLFTVVGLLPIMQLTIKQNSEAVFKTSDKDLIYFSVYFTAYFVLLLHNFKLIIDNLYDNEMDYFFNVFQIPYILLLLIHSCSNMVYAYFNRNLLKAVLQYISRVDESLENINSQINHRFIKMRISFLSSVLLILSTFKACLFFSIPEIGYSQQLALLLLDLLQIALTVALYTLALLLLERFREINRILTFYKEKMIFDGRKIQILCHCHYGLFQIAHMINKLIGFQLLMCLILYTVNACIQFYFIYVLLTRNIKIRVIIKFAAIVFWFIGGSLGSFLAVKCCSDTYEAVSFFFINNSL